MSGVRVIGEPPDPAAIFAAFEAEARAAGREAKAAVRDALIANTPRLSNATAEAVEGTYRKAGDGFVGTVRFKLSRRWVAKILEGGAKPHAIRPRKTRQRYSGQRTALGVPGVGPRSAVRHPGIAARRFIDKTETQVQPTLDRIYDRAAERATKRVDAL